jgi:hypothetical protein
MDDKLLSMTVAKSDQSIIARAFAAWFRSSAAIGTAIQPPQDSSVAEVAGKRYVVLQNVKGILAVYRIMNAGQLKRLKRWPAELEAD